MYIEGDTITMHVSVDECNVLLRALSLYDGHYSPGATLNKEEQARTEVMKGLADKMLKEIESELYRRYHAEMAYYENLNHAAGMMP